MYRNSTVTPEQINDRKTGQRKNLGIPKIMYDKFLSKRLVHAIWLSIYCITIV